jgi:hypothetical protein
LKGPKRPKRSERLRRISFPLASIYDELETMFPLASELLTTTFQLESEVVATTFPLESELLTTTFPLASVAAVNDSEEAYT